MSVTFLALLAVLIGCRDNSGGDLRQPPGPVPDQTLTFAWYNVENMFDPADDTTRVGDDEFTPEGRLNWTQARLEGKLTNVSRAIRAMNDMRGPDAIGLCEVENRHVLEELAGDFLPAGEYAIVHAESPDERGIDVALLYKPSAMTLKGVVMHRVDLGPAERPTRDVMEAAFVKDGRAFTILANHWPSKRGGDQKSAPRRDAAAAVAAAVIDSLCKLDSNADIVLMGDLNDTPGTEVVTGALDARGLAAGQKFTHRIINTARPNEATDTIGSYYYGGHWETIDQIMLSRGALDDVGLVIADTTETIFCPDFLRDFRNPGNPAVHPPYRTCRGPIYIGGPSDHFPVTLRVGWISRRGKTGSPR